MNWCIYYWYIGKKCIDVKKLVYLIVQLKKDNNIVEALNSDELINQLDRLVHLLMSKRAFSDERMDSCTIYLNE